MNGTISSDLLSPYLYTMAPTTYQRAAKDCASQLTMLLGSRPPKYLLSGCKSSIIFQWHRRTPVTFVFFS